MGSNFGRAFERAVFIEGKNLEAKKRVKMG
jgi:hypothetical protein